MNLLVDSQSFIWYVIGDARLPAHFRTLIESPSNSYSLSIASIWELGIKDSIGKLRLDLPLEELIEGHIVESGVSVLNLSIDHILSMKKLPHYHRDPFDRIIIAQAIAEDLTIVTTDPQFDKYPVQLA